MNKQPKFKLRVQNKVDELEKIHSTVERIINEWGIPLQLGMCINLAIEEAFTNVVNYAFHDNEQHLVDIEFIKKEDQIEIIITDDGQHYDPTQKDDPQTDLPLEDRPVGGLGIFLIRKLMDNVEYQRNSDKNILKLTKRITI
jgi:serine/threonine-protein kinase RsbW